MNLSHVQHLYWRAGFGLGPKQLSKLVKNSKEKVVSDLFKNKTKYTPLEIDLSEYEILINGSFSKTKKEMGAEAFKMFLKKSRREVRNLNGAWIDRLNTTDAVFLEKMTLFWANIFVCKDQNIWHIQQYNNILRKNALGNFKDFVIAISCAPSMIDYLNNKQNKKESPNENFARELMELFTLGAGNYTENDIKESARAFTGWTYKKRRGFFINKEDHDYGEKTFFGKTGDFDGNHIIDIILEQKQCARFVCEKIYTYFVNPTINKIHIEELTNVFYENYDIKKLMYYIFSSNWFYEKENIGVKIKSPIELMVGIYRTVPYSFNKPQQALFLQKMMGQVLLYPVNVAGWKGNTDWIDSNTLMFRLKLSSMLLNNAIINLDAKGDIEDTFEAYYTKRKNAKHYLKMDISWNIFEKEYKNLNSEKLKNILVLSRINKNTEKMIDQLIIKNNKDYCVQLMSIPEYQLC